MGISPSASRLGEVPATSTAYADTTTSTGSATETRQAAVYGDNSSTRRTASSSPYSGVSARAERRGGGAGGYSASDVSGNEELLRRSPTDAPLYGPRGVGGPLSTAPPPQQTAEGPSPVLLAYRQHLRRYYAQLYGTYAYLEGTLSEVQRRAPDQLAVPWFYYPLTPEDDVLRLGGSPPPPPHQGSGEASESSASNRPAPAVPTGGAPPLYSEGAASLEAPSYSPGPRVVYGLRGSMQRRFDWWREKSIELYEWEAYQRRIAADTGNSGAPLQTAVLQRQRWWRREQASAGDDDGSGAASDAEGGTMQPVHERSPPPLGSDVFRSRLAPSQTTAAAAGASSSSSSAWWRRARVWHRRRHPLPSAAAAAPAAVASSYWSAGDGAALPPVAAGNNSSTCHGSRVYGSPARSAPGPGAGGLGAKGWRRNAFFKFLNPTSTPALVLRWFRRFLLPPVVLYSIYYTNVIYPEVLAESLYDAMGERARKELKLEVKFLGVDGEEEEEDTSNSNM